MTDLHQIFDSLVGYLVGMTFVEVVLTSLFMRNGQKLIREVDQDPSLPDWVIPDYLWSELECGRGAGGVGAVTRLRSMPSPIEASCFLSAWTHVNDFGCQGERKTEDCGLGCWVDLPADVH